MSSRAAGPILFKSWFSWFRGSLLLRLVGSPALLLALYLEVYGSSPTAPSLILHRLVRRIRSSTFLDALNKTRFMTSSSIFYVGGADSMDRAQTTQTLHDKGANAAPEPKSMNSDAATLASLSRPPPNMPSHTRSKTIDVVGQGKRLSLQFPIQPAAGSNSPSFSPRSRPQSWVPGTPRTPSVHSPEPVESTSETSLLAVLAAQERYVLELKEELSKAEVDLDTLKKHWILIESNKRRNDSRKVAALQPLNTSLANVPTGSEPYDDDGSNIWMQKEMERRKAILNSTRTTQRKVFSGSRHLRTLSLLSPDRSDAPPLPQSLNLHDDQPTNVRPQPPTRASTSSDIVRPLAFNGDHDRYDMSGMPNIQREQIIRAGTQMATDFKKGLFTFIEDIRQATVGDEAGGPADGNPGSINAKGPSTKTGRKPSDGRPPLSRSASSRKSVQNTGSIGDDFWKEMGLSEPKSTTAPKKTHAKNTTPKKQTRKVANEEEDWDNWDTPNDSQDLLIKTDDSSEESDAHSGQASSRTSMSAKYHATRHDSKASSVNNGSIMGQEDATPSKRNSLPWPDLQKMSPSNLKRTASHLMKEWEKQLTPPPESRTVDYSHGDYMN